MRSPARTDAMTNRRFGTTDLAIVMGLWSAMAVLLGGVLSEIASDNETPMAKAQSEAYALQLEQGLESPSETTGRSPASFSPPDKGFLNQEGSLGKDPWGRAYIYKVVSDGVLVYSEGKNGECDSKDALARLAKAQSLRDFHFSGDDVGFVKTRSTTAGR